MVAVSYHCPYCGAVTSVEREGYLHDKCVSREPLDGWTYADTTGDFETADGIEFVCLGDGGAGNGARVASDDTDPEAGGAEDPNPEKDGCGRTFYLSFLKYEDGEPVDHRTPNIDRPRFDFSP
jgi:hypothetical protein